MSEEVVQVYVKADDEKAPLHPRLCGFGRVRSRGNDSGRIQINLDQHTFEVIDDAGKRVPAAGGFTLYAGTSQPDRRSQELTGKKPVQIEIR